MGQLLLSKYSILPSYLKVSNCSRTWYCARNSVPADTWASVTARWWCLHFTPLLHIVVTKCPVTISSRGMNMFHCSHQGWGPGPSLSTTMVSSTFQCMKLSQRLVQLVTLPVHPSTRKSMDVSIRRKSTGYYLDLWILNGCSRGLAYPDRQCCV